TTPIEPTDLQRTKAEQLKIVLKRSRQETRISQQSASDTETGKGGDEVRESEGEEEEETSEEEEVVLTRFLEHLKIVRRKAMMRRSRNQGLVRRQ
nr:hypothetical protein [Tanacetum cinerariifolium]